MTIAPSSRGSDRVVVLPRLGTNDAPRLAPLVAEYSAVMMGHDVAAIDEGYVAKLIADRVVEVAGVEVDGKLAGFALYYDLPEAISGRRAGQLDDLYVRPATRGLGAARALIAHLTQEGLNRGWIHLRWMAPNASPAHALYERLAERAPWRAYVVRIDRSVAW